MDMTTEVFSAIMHNIHAYVLLIDRDFYVQYTNYYDLMKEPSPKAPVKVGNLLHCTNALQAEGGCGTHTACGHCPVRGAIEHAYTRWENFTGTETQLILQDKKGALKLISVEIAGECINLNGAPHMVITVHDITRTKIMEAELKEKRRKAEDANEAKSRFLANMSHEIRTPLNAIVGFAELLSSVDTAEEKEEFFSIIKSNSDLLQHLINEVLDMAKIESGKIKFEYKEVTLNPLMQELHQQYRMRIGETGKALTIDCVTPKEDIVLYTDYTRLLQVLNNFLTNAIKYSDKGLITLGYYPTKAPDGTHQLYFYVSDQGTGISEENLPHTFERLARFHEDRPGNGLGLSLCKAIIEKMGGQIGVESTFGSGSNFWFTLPMK